MIIHTLFNWFQGDEELFNLPNQTLSRELLESEKIQANNTNRILLNEIRFAKLNGLLTTVLVDKLEKHALLMKYLEFCENKLIDQPQNSLLLITLKYLLSQPIEEQTQLISKINKLFGALFEIDKENTLIFYKENKKLFTNCHEIREQIQFELSKQKIEKDIQNVKSRLVYLNKLLSEQKNPLGIVGLGRDWISDTGHFAALILWLLQQGCSTKEIMQTHLLHDFFKYYLFTLHNKKNEIARLYNLLSCFPKTNDLRKEVQKTASDERGFQNYSLNGIISKKEQELQNIPLRSPSLHFSQTTNNFLALHKLFGHHFLIAAIITSETHTHPEWLEMLNLTVNNPQIVTEELPSIIYLIAREYSPLSLKNLADLIGDGSIQLLLSNNEGIISYLLPYKPNLINSISEKNISEFIQKIHTKNTSDSEVLFQLGALFVTLSKKKHPATQLVFQELIQNLVLHPTLLEDDELLRQLQKYPDVKLLLSQRCETIIKKFNECILDQTTEQLFSKHNYEIIEDNWLDASRKFSIFARIYPQIKFKLDHKYALQAKIAKNVFLHHGEHFDLDAFIGILYEPPVTLLTEVSEYERILIEMLAVIDNELIRKQIVEKLETYPIKRMDWMKKEYEEKSVLFKAAKHGNLGLFIFLTDRIEQAPWNKVMITAAKANQWDIVTYLYQRNKVLLNKEEIKQIVGFAAQHSQLKIIQNLYHDYDYLPSTHELIHILNIAITNGQLDIVKYFYNSAFKLKQAVINKLFNLAVESGYVEIIKFIANTKKHILSLSTIEKAVEQTASNMQLEIMHELCNLSLYTLRPQVIHQIFIKACQLGHLPVVQYLHDLCDIKLDSPSPLVIKQSLLMAIKKGKKEIVEYLCMNEIEVLTQSIIEEALISAAKLNQLAIVQYLCNISTKTPNKKALKIVLNHLDDQKEIITYLHDRLQYKPNLRKKLRTKINDQHEQSNLCLTHRFFIPSKTQDKSLSSTYKIDPSAN